MWNIIRSQNYQLRRDNYIVNVFLIITAITVGAMLIDGFWDADAATYIAWGLGENFLMILAALMFIVTRCSAWDYRDKTINYELMAGHSRKEIYWGRVLCSILWGCVGSVIIMLLPILLLAGINGWGNSVEWHNIYLRFLLLFFPLFRLTGLYVMISTIMRSSSKGLLISAVSMSTILVVTSMAEELADINVTYHFGFSNAVELVIFSNAKEVLIDGEVVNVAESAVEPSLILATIVVSLVMGFIYLLIGYNYFKKSDRD